MLCPTCTDTRLVMTDRQGIEIDYCPKCRGVWLDKGELDKIIERASTMPSEAYQQAPPPPPTQQQSYQQQPYQQHPQQHSQQHQPYQQQHNPNYYKKKKSFWDEVFDFD
jgi:uncharacterized protein